MKNSLPIVASLGICFALVGGMASAQTPEELACAKTRAEVKADCVQFLKTHEWSEAAGTYVLKASVKPPEGVKTREQIVAERNKFLAANRWDDGKTMWVPIAGKPRDTANEPLECAKTRAEVRNDCTAFLKTHRWDDGASTYVLIKK